MRTVEAEIVFCEQRRRQLVDHCRLGVDDRAAGVTHDVHVLVLDRTVGRRAVPEVGVPDEAEFLEHLEVAVDRGDVDARSPDSLICSGVAWPSSRTAASTCARWGVARMPRERSRSASSGIRASGSGVLMAVPWAHRR